MEHTVEDLGTYSRESVDYPEYGHKCGEAVASGRVRAVRASRLCVDD